MRRLIRIAIVGVLACVHGAGCTTPFDEDLIVRVHAGNLKAGKDKFDVTVHDQMHRSTGGSVVGATFYWGTQSEALTCTTSDKGKCSMRPTLVRPPPRDSYLVVIDIMPALGRYEGSANHDPDDDSDGTTISF